MQRAGCRLQGRRRKKKLSREKWVEGQWASGQANEAIRVSERKSCFYTTCFFELGRVGIREFHNLLPNFDPAQSEFQKPILLPLFKAWNPYFSGGLGKLGFRRVLPSPNL